MSHLLDCSVRVHVSSPRAACVELRRNARGGNHQSTRSKHFRESPPFQNTKIVIERGRSVVTKAVSVSEVQLLNEQYAIPGFVEFKEGQGGLPTVVLQHISGAKAEVLLFGACISSWRQASGSEVLYIRPDAVFDKSKPVSGGVPLCFPQFGPGVIQQHGFARNSDWAVASTSADLQPDEKEPEVQLVLTENEYTLAMWPYKFKVAYSISLHGEQLRTEFRVMNTDDKPFDFTAALHTYFEVLDIEQAAVRGLQGLGYLDKVSDPSKPVEGRQDTPLLTFSGPMDSVYLGAPNYLELDVGTGASIALSSSGWDDAVVWTPWEAMPACYRSFVCVENAKVGSAVTLQPGDSWRATTEYSVIDTPQ